MILDLQSRFSGAVSAAGVTTGDALTVTAISSNVIDLTNGSGTPATQDLGISLDGNHSGMWLVVQTDSSADFAAVGAATLQITVESDSAVGLGTSTVHLTSPVIAKATMLKNTVLWRTKLPSDTYKRYLGLRYTVGTGPFTAGAILAVLTPQIDRNVIYAAGFTIDV